ncbi:MAG: tetratricopeptide repeat protein [Deltaproteobacteria bacterium]|nr:tetratricopeptide repeat protein [Deltaproteobacteria bacterium]
MSDEARLWTELGALGQEPLPGERTDAQIVEAALAGLADPTTAPAPAPVEPAPSQSGRRVAVIAIVSLALAAAAIVLGWWVLPSMGLIGGDGSDPANMAPAVLDDDPAQGHAVAADSRGGATVPSTPTPLADEPDEPECETSAEACAALAGTTGAAMLEAATDSDSSDSDSDSDSPATPRPRRPRTAPALLEHAQRLVSSGDRTGAIAAYERLVARFEGTPEAKAARVSLGRLELRRGRAKKALAHFDAYLSASAGALVEEARYGRVRALRKLGRHTQELRSIEAFLADHPGSLYAARLRKRAEELRTP